MDIGNLTKKVCTSKMSDAFWIIHEIIYENWAKNLFKKSQSKRN